MWQEPIVKDRVQTALKEGITSQSIAQARQDHNRGDSILNGLLQSIGRLWKKEPGQTRDAQKSFGFQQSEDTG
jgi:hypothetical protein